MNLRIKKTLSALLSGVAVLALGALSGLARGGHFAPGPGFFVCVALLLATTWYTWWWYGDSPKAVAVRAKAEAKRAARQQLR